MVNEVVLIQCEVDEIPEAAQAIAGIDGVSEVYSVPASSTSWRSSGCRTTTTWRG
jgi:hypothetical protein